MVRTIEVVYEGGVFRPLEEVDLEDGTRGEVRIYTNAEPEPEEEWDIVD
jgi:predicted DNA-binding antitoxin AbrB/MazE fold protein